MYEIPGSEEFHFGNSFTQGKNGKLEILLRMEGISGGYLWSAITLSVILDVSHYQKSQIFFCFW